MLQLFSLFTNQFFTPKVCAKFSVMITVNKGIFTNFCRFKFLKSLQNLGLILSCPIQLIYRKNLRHNAIDLTSQKSQNIVLFIKGFEKSAVLDN